MTPGSRVLTIVVCGAGPAAAIGTCVKLAQDRGWTVQVIATPAVERSARSLVHSARTTRTWVTGPATVAGAGVIGAGAGAGAP